MKMANLDGVYKVLNEYTRKKVPMVQISILRASGITETHHLRKADLSSIRPISEVAEIGPAPSDEDEITRELAKLWGVR